MAANCGLNYLAMARFVGFIALRQIGRLCESDEAAPPRSQEGQPQTQSLLDAFSLHRASLVLHELLQELRVSLTSRLPEFWLDHWDMTCWLLALLQTECPSSATCSQTCPPEIHSAELSSHFCCAGCSWERIHGLLV